MQRVIKETVFTSLATKIKAIIRMPVKILIKSDLGRDLLLIVECHNLMLQWNRGLLVSLIQALMYH